MNVNKIKTVVVGVENKKKNSWVVKENRQKKTPNVCFVHKHIIINNNERTKMCVVNKKNTSNHFDVFVNDDDDDEEITKL